jgi:hypothetical protein
MRKNIQAPPKANVPYAGLIFPKDVITAINNLNIQTHANNMVVENVVELDPTREHRYGTVEIKNGGLLTVSQNLSLTLNVDILRIEVGGKLSLSGKGYLGGAPVPCVSDGLAFQGDSVRGAGAKNRQNNGGGGGAGEGSSKFGSTGGGGGGYGTSGGPGSVNVYGGGNFPAGCAGGVYGSQEITELLLGSGGGSGHPYSQGSGGKGGNGGGALKVVAKKIIVWGTIACDGEDGGQGVQYGSGGGGGSGGSIHLHAEEVRNFGQISAQGGKGGLAHPTFENIASHGGSGGLGRIRIDTPRGGGAVMGNIVPAPYHVVLY